MIGQKTKMGIAVTLAILSALLLVGISYIFFPDQKPDQMPIPKPAPSIIDQLFGAILWIGLAALIAIAIVGAILLVNRIRRKKTDTNIEICASHFEFRLQITGALSQYCKVSNSFEQCLVFLLNLTYFRVFFH